MVVINTIVVYVLLIQTWGWRYSSKKSVQQKMRMLILKWEIDALLRTRIGWFKKNHAEHVCFFIVFFGDKKEWHLKVLLTCTFIPWLLNSFDLPSYDSEFDENMHTKTVIGVCRSGRGEFCNLFCLEGETIYLW